MSYKLQLMLLGASLGAWTACSPTTEPRVEVVKPTDGEVEQVVRHRIAASGVSGGENVDVDADVDRGSITLSGAVATQSARLQLVTLTRDAQPAYTVNDKIEVKPADVALSQYTAEMATQTREAAEHAGEKLGASLEDAWLHTKIKAKLAADEKTPARTINVDVSKNVVTLRGEVESIEASREAEQVARATEGVRRVVNLLKVKS